MTDEEYVARQSLVQELAVGLRLRGFWVPRDVDSKDFGKQSQIISAVFSAIDSILLDAKVGKIARKICTPGSFDLTDSPFSFMHNIKQAVKDTEQGEF